MESKTQIHAVDGVQELFITREFDLPVDLLFRAYVEPELVEQWMNTKVIKLEAMRHGSYHYVTTDPKGNAHHFNGTIHEYVPNEKITRTFEMENTPFPVQLEFIRFEPLTEDTSKLSMQFIYQSVAHRDAMLKLPFKMGINMAHDRLQEILKLIKR